MNEEKPSHPAATTMAAFIDGKLPPAEVATVADHLRACGDCCTVVAETARFEAEEELTRPPRRVIAWLAAVAIPLAAVAIPAAILASIPYLQPALTPSPIAALIAAAPREHRTVDARLSGFPWARLQAPARGRALLADPADLKLSGAAGQVLDKTLNATTPASRHAAGVAWLLTDCRPKSIAALEAAARSCSDPRVWNDLAAARYQTAVRDEQVSQLPLALSDVDHALRLDAKGAEALFNRALILEALGWREAARQAWERYLEVDPAGGWSAEARAHLARLTAARAA